MRFDEFWGGFNTHAYLLQATTKPPRCLS